MYTITDLFDLDHTIAKDLFVDKEFPWEVLPEIGDFIIRLGNTLSLDEYDHPSENVWIAKDATVFPSAYINRVSLITELKFGSAHLFAGML